MSVLSPLDLLSVPAVEQDIIRCLVRQPKLTAEEIAGRTKIPLEELANLLKQMVGDARLVQQVDAGQTLFRVAISRSQSPERGANALLDNLFG